jgi:hypothetical protein
MMNRKGPARYKPDRRWKGVGISRRNRDRKGAIRGDRYYVWESRDGI